MISTMIFERSLINVVSCSTAHVLGPSEDRKKSDEAHLHTPCCDCESGEIDRVSSQYVANTMRGSIESLPRAGNPSLSDADTYCMFVIGYKDEPPETAV